MSRLRSFGSVIQGRHTGVQPWSRLYSEGHANHWGPAATYIETHHATWVDALLVTSDCQH